MPVPKPKKPVQSSQKPATKAGSKPTSVKVAVAAEAKAPAKKPELRVKTVPASKPTVRMTALQMQEAADALLKADQAVKKKPGRPPKAATESDDSTKAVVKRGRKPKAAAESGGDDTDMSDIEADLVGEEPVAVPGEKVKPLRMKISKAKERALMKEFGLDETVLSEEDIAKRRLRLKALIKLGKTRGYLTHGEISDHLPDKLVDAETLEVVIAMLNDMGVAVFEQTPDAETLLLNNNVSTAATEEEAEEEAEAALSTVDSEFGRTTDPVRMYMREMGTVE